MVMVRMNTLVGLIVAGTLWAGGAVAADLLVRNVRGATPTSDGMQHFSCLLVSDGRVEAVGGTQACSGWKAKQVVEGQGKAMLPGLIDAHGHMLWLGLRHTRVDLVGTQSLAEALQRVRDFAREHPDDEWILGRGWNQEQWPEKRFPTAAELDQAVADRPVWLGRIDGHASWANSEAIRRAGVTSSTPDPHGGKIERLETGRPAGVFVDAASALVDEHVPPPSHAQRKQALRLAALELASLGITGVHDAGVDSLTLAAYKELAAGEGMAVRVYAMLSGDEYGQMEPPPPLSVNGELLVVRSIKLYADGAMGSRGAAFLEPYQDDPDNKGLLFLEQEQLDALVQKWSHAGYQVNVHAIGDRAIQVVLNAFETLDGGERAQRRHRVEHAQVGTVEDLKRFSTLNIIPSMQPTHATSDWAMVIQRLDEGRTAGAYAWRTLLDDGNRIAAGSDFPVESADPLLGLYAGVTRIDLQGKPPGGWMPEQRMTLEEVLRAFTLDAAYAAHQEASLGSLEVGKSADFILLDRDLFSGDVELIKQAKVVATWLAGKQTYSAGTP